MEERKEEKTILVMSSFLENAWQILGKIRKNFKINGEYLDSKGLENLKKEATKNNIKVISFIKNKALLNKINEGTGLNLSLCPAKLKAEIKEGQIIYSVSVPNLGLHEYSEEEDLPEGAELQIFRYEF